MISTHKKNTIEYAIFVRFCLWINNDTRAHIYIYIYKEIMLLLQLCSMTWLSVKRFFFSVLEPRAMLFTGKMSKEKKERGRIENEEKKGAATSHSGCPSG